MTLRSLRLPNWLSSWALELTRSRNVLNLHTYAHKSASYQLPAALQSAACARMYEVATILENLGALADVDAGRTTPCDQPISAGIDQTPSTTAWEQGRAASHVEVELP